MAIVAFLRTYTVNHWDLPPTRHIQVAIKDTIFQLEVVLISDWIQIFQIGFQDQTYTNI